MGDRLGTPRVVDTFLFFSLFCYLIVWLGSFVQADGPPGAFVLMIQLYAIFGEKYSKLFFQKNFFF